jgi:hypothetical protein
MFTVRLIIKVRGTKRIIKEFIRAEYALNTSSHADRFYSIDEAEMAADKLAEIFTAAGHTIIGTDIFKVQ